MRSELMLLALSSMLVATGCSIEGPQTDSEPVAAGRPDRGPGPDEGGRPDDATAEPIKGGAEATAYPEAVLVDMKQNGWQAASCSGAMIAPRVVLTAGHCVAGYDGWDVIAPYAGWQQASASDAATYDWTANGGYVNPNQHDVGLIFLGSEISLGAYPTLASSAIAGGTEVLNVGRKINGQLSSSKLFVSQPVSAYDGAGYGFPYDYASAEVIEPGDSGGPVLLLGGAPHTIVAVNSGAGGSWQVLARVDLVGDWIAQQVAAHGGNTPPAPPDPPAPASCSHELCIEGSALDSGCDDCAGQICAQDGYCCSTAWDQQCVSEVQSICSQSCGQPPPPPSDPCGGVSFEGTCDGAVLQWCGNGELHTVDCAQSGKQCGWDSGHGYYDCL